VCDILEKLRVNAPDIHADALVCLPQAVYDPQRLLQEEPDGVIARADGVFAIDGSDLEMFYWVFLHELGHMVAVRKGVDHGEWVANRYADETMDRLGFHSAKT
jgi:hypothetical protein